MKRELLIITTLSVLFFGLFASPTATQAQATDVSIGMLTPLTGALGDLGKGFVDAAQLAINDINAAQSDYNFILEVHDTQTSPSSTTTAANALVDADVIGVVGAAASSTTLAAIPVLKDAQIPLVSYASTYPHITTNDDDGYLFRTVASDSLQGNAAAALAELQDVNSVAIINVDDIYGKGLASGFQTVFQAAGGTVEVVIVYDNGNTDLSTHVTSLVDSGAEAVYMVSYLQEGRQILMELEDQGFDGVIFTSELIASNSLIDETITPGITEAALGIIGTASTITGTNAFNSAYEAEYGNYPSIFNAEAYDAAYLIAQAYIDAASSIVNPTGTDVRDSLSIVGTNYEGVSGTFSFDSNGDRTTVVYDIWQFQEGDEGVSISIVGNYSNVNGFSDLTIVDYSPMLIATVGNNSGYLELYASIVFVFNPEVYDTYKFELNGETGSNFDLNITNINGDIVSSANNNIYPDITTVNVSEPLVIKVYSSSGSGEFVLTISQVLDPIDNPSNPSNSSSSDPIPENSSDDQTTVPLFPFTIILGIVSIPVLQLFVKKE